MDRLGAPLTRWPAQRVEWSAAGLALILVARPDDHNRQAARRLARQVVSEALAELLSMPVQQLALVEGASGPQLADDHHDLRISLSYAGDWILIGIAKARALGVDIVRVESLPEREALCLHYLPETFCQAVDEVPTPLRDTAFAAQWARMEACCKCLGLPLSEITPNRSLALQSCQLVECEQTEGYRIGVAISSSPVRPANPARLPGIFWALA